MRREVITEPVNQNLFEHIEPYSNIGKDNTQSPPRTFLPSVLASLRRLIPAKHENSNALPQNISTPSESHTIAHSPYLWFLAGGSLLFAGAALKPGYPVTVFAALGAAAIILGAHYFIDNHEEQRGG